MRKYLRASPRRALPLCHYYYDNASSISLFYSFIAHIYSYYTIVDSPDGAEDTSAAAAATDGALMGILATQ